MVEVKLGPKTVDLPYTLRIKNVTEETFDELVSPGIKAELFDGVMVVHSLPSTHHSYLSGFIRTLMQLFADETDAGDVFGPHGIVRLSASRKLAPGFFFVIADRVPFPLPEKEFPRRPDLAGEVLSPHSRDDDLGFKRFAYRQAGVREIWFIDPDVREVTVDRMVKGKYTTTTVTNGEIDSDVLKGFWLDTAWLWAEPMPKVTTCLRAIFKKWKRQP